MATVNDAPQKPAYAPYAAPQVSYGYPQQHVQQQYGHPQYVQQKREPVYTYANRRQSVKTHLWLLLLTGGLGNIAYAAWARSSVAARHEW